MLMETRCCKVCFQTTQKKKRLKILSYRGYGNNEKNVCFLIKFYKNCYKHVSCELFVHAAARGGTCTFTLKIANTLIKTAHATIDFRSRHRSNPRPTRFVSGKAGECWWSPRRYQVDPWSRRRAVARGVQRSYAKPKKRSRITGRIVNTVTKGWVP